MHVSTQVKTMELKFIFKDVCCQNEIVFFFPFFSFLLPILIIFVLIKFDSLYWKDIFLWRQNWLHFSVTKWRYILTPIIWNKDDDKKPFIMSWACRQTKNSEHRTGIENRTFSKPLGYGDPWRTRSFTIHPCKWHASSIPLGSLKTPYLVMN